MYSNTWPCSFVFLVMWVPLQLFISEVFTAYTAEVDQIHPHTAAQVLDYLIITLCCTSFAYKDANDRMAFT